MIDKAILKLLAMMCYCASWLIFGHDHPNGFFRSLAIGFFLQFVSCTRPIKYSDLNFRLNIIGIILCLSNIVDEFFCNPEKFEWNEIVFSLLTIIIVCRAKRNKGLFRYL